jgi:hypothetical protein
VPSGSTVLSAECGHYELAREHDISGWVSENFPLHSWTFLIGSRRSAALPLVTAGLQQGPDSLAGLVVSRGNPWLWADGEVHIDWLHHLSRGVSRLFGEGGLRRLPKPDGQGCA